MKEFTTPSFLLYMVDGEGSHVVRSMGEVSDFLFLCFISDGVADEQLLPDSFGPNDLQK